MALKKKYTLFAFFIFYVQLLGFLFLNDLLLFIFLFYEPLLYNNVIYRLQYICYRTIKFGK